MNVSHTRQGLKTIIQSYSRSKFHLSIRNNTHIQSISNYVKINSDLLMCVSNDTCNRTVALILIRLLNHKACEQDWWIWHEKPVMWNWTYRKNTNKVKLFKKGQMGNFDTSGSVYFLGNILTALQITMCIKQETTRDKASRETEYGVHFILQHHRQD